MLTLRLVRGYGPADLVRLALTALAAAVAAALLLRALGRALAEPDAVGAAITRLAWCLPALGAVGYWCAVCAGSLETRCPERAAGLAAVGIGPQGLRRRLLLAEEAALACALGALLACLGFLALRSGLVRPLPAGRLDRALAVGSALPPAGTLTLLAVVPLVCGAAAGAAVGTGERERAPLASVVLLISAGLTVETLANWVPGPILRLPALGAVSAFGLAGWAGASAGLALGVPGLLHALGSALACGRPRALRLLAGRGLQAEAGRLSGPVAVLSVGLGAALCRGPGDVLSVPLRATEFAVGVSCALGALAVRAAEIRASRTPLTDPILSLGLPPRLLRGAAALRGAACASATLLTACATAALTLLL